MKAMILAAGLGTRLKPLTDKIPKALVSYEGQPLIEHVIKKLINHGFDEIIVNVHHFAGQITEYLRNKKKFGIRIEISDESDLLLDTGGGLKKAAWFFDDGNPFLVHNVDIISDTDLSALYKNHLDYQPIAMLSVRSRKSSRCLLFDESGILCGWKNFTTGQVIMPRKTENPPLEMAFNGIQILSTRIFDFMPDNEVFSLIDLYLNLAARENIRYYYDNSTSWIDAGKKQQF